MNGFSSQGIEPITQSQASNHGQGSRARWFARLRAGLALVLALLISCGCDAEEDESVSQKPLAPLVYTEVPEITPEAAAVRERRILRQVVEGQPVRSGDENRPPEQSGFEREALLGEAFEKALVERDERLWESLFVQPDAYASLVGVTPDEAVDFVDEIQGESQAVWRLFRPDSPSRARDGGFSAVVAFRELHLGDPRDLAGNRAPNGEGVQFWNNKVVFEHRLSDTVFTFQIDKIVRVARGPGQFSFAIASGVSVSQRLKTLIDAGLHLKPELLRSGEYPFPIQVGTFWSYSIQLSELDDPIDQGGTRLMVEVVSVDRFESFRLVQMTRTYNDSSMSRGKQWWLASPSRMDLCESRCRESVEDVGALLDYLTERTPEYVFPITGAWPQDNPVFHTQSVEVLEVPAGSYYAAVRIDGRGRLGTFDRRLRTHQSRFFAVGQGVVRRVLGRGDAQVVEELVDLRIMP